jgi:hypothetical protein
LKEDGLDMGVLGNLDISVLVRCVGEASIDVKGIWQVSALMFSDTYGGRNDAISSLEELMPIIYNMCVQATVASKLNPRQHRALSSVTHL